MADGSGAENDPGLSSTCTDDEHARAPSTLVPPRNVPYQVTPASDPSVIQDHEQLARPEEESEPGEPDNKHQYAGQHEVRRHWSESRAATQSLPSASSDPGAYDAEQSRRSSNPPRQHSAEIQTACIWQDIDHQQEQAKPILHLWNFTAYTWVQKFSYFTTLVAVALTALMCMQIFLVSIDCYESYNIRSEHSHCSCSFPYPWLVTAALRITSRFAFPLLLSIVFWRQVVYSKAATTEDQPGTAKGTFAAEIEKEHNHRIVRELVEKFWITSVKPSDSGKKLLERIRDQMNSELTWMCITSLLQSALLVITLSAFRLVAVSKTNWFESLFLLGVVDIFSFGTITAVSGVMLSFYFLESKIKCYVRVVHTLPSTSRALRDKAKATEHCITNRWYPLEIGMRFASVIIPAILLMSWASDVPLSCGFSISEKATTEQSAAACWMGFIVVVTIGQVMVTSHYKPFYIRWTGLSVEVAILSIFYLTFPTYEWMQLTHVLYAIVPLSYLVWYHIASIRRQWLAINRTKEGNPTYVSRLASRTGLLILILATLAVSLRVEYSHLHPSSIGKYSWADINPQPPDISHAIMPAGISSMKHVRADHEKVLLQQLAEKYNAMLYFVEEKIQSDRDVCFSSQGQEYCNV